MPIKTQITFLGTSAQIPTADRNHSAILLSYNDENILVDCGEGTQRQFRKAKLNPCKLTRILITHWHADHVLGLPGILSTLALSGYNKTLYIYGPKWTKEFMADLLKVFNFERKYKIEVKEVANEKFFENNDFYLEAHNLSHGIPCNAYSFVKKAQIRIDKSKLKKAKLPNGPLLGELKKGKDISYNGKKFKAKDFVYNEKAEKVCFILDTLYKKEISSFAKDSDLLICESSFDSELEDKAKEHLHLTARQAAEIAKASKSKKLILTHISQRFENGLKYLISDAKKSFKNVEIVKDFDVVKV